MSRRAVFVVLVTAFAAAGACSSFDATSESTPALAEGGVAEPPPAADGATTDPDAGQHDTDADALAPPPNLLVNGDFELGSCAPPVTVIGVASTASTANPVHGGSNACELCVTDGGVPAYWYGNASQAPQAGDTYVFEGWVHAPASDPVVTTPFSTKVVLRDSNGIKVAESSSAQSPVPAAGSWTKIANALQVTSSMLDAGNVKVGFELAYASESPGHCFVLDDVRLYVGP